MSSTNAIEKHQGQVKFYNRTNGYGFITRIKDNKDFFVHLSGISPSTDCIPVLFPGEYVEFELEDGIKGEQSVYVTGISGGKLMCEFEGRTRRTRKNKNKESEEQEPVQE